MRPVDYHLHSPLCRHAEGHPTEYAASAFSLGMDECGLSDHSPMAAPFDDWRMLREELPRYVEMVDEARAAHPGKTIRLGLEVDYLLGQERWIEALATMAPWDYFIGAVHYVTPDWAIDDPQWVGSSRWAGAAVTEIWEGYWRAYASAIRSGLFDFFAHPDLPKKFGYIPPGDLRPYYDLAIQAAVDAQAVFEINTAGLRNTAGDVYPHRDFIERAVEAGIPFIISSDAHKPEHVGYAFDQAWRLLWDCGARTTVRFAGRNRRIVALDEPPQKAAVMEA
jgi:histidinol-phosphatase (PHP family)